MQFKLWNEETFDVNSVPFTKQAYDNKKWAFVSDYVRLYALFHYGGWYLDTDVEIRKPLEPFIEKKLVLVLMKMVALLHLWDRKKDLFCGKSF